MCVCGCVGVCGCVCVCMCVYEDIDHLSFEISSIVGVPLYDIFIIIYCISMECTAQYWPQ